MKRNDYRSGSNTMTDEELFNQYFFYHRYNRNKTLGSTSNLTKEIYFENLLINKRGWTTEQITDKSNKIWTEEYHANKLS